MRSLLSWAFALTIAGVSQGIVCPPCGPGQEEECPQAILAEGQACGGLCGEIGWCRSGLSCLQPVDESRTVNILKHALGVPRVGKCAHYDPDGKESGLYEVIHPFRVGSSPPDTSIDQAKARKLQSAPCAGCPQQGDPHDEAVVQAAQAALEIAKKREEFGPEFGEVAQHTSLVTVQNVTTQVVSGIRYRMRIVVKTVNEERKYDVDIVSQPWMTPPYNLIEFTRVEDSSSGTRREERTGTGSSARGSAERSPEPDV